MRGALATSKNGLRLTAALLVGLASASLCAAQQDLSDPETAVEAGRAGLDGIWDAPWYDSQTDDFRPVDLPRPRPPSAFWQWFWGLFSGFSYDWSGVLQILAWLLLALLVVWGVIALVRAVQAAELERASAVAEEELERAEIERIEALPVAVDDPVGDFAAEARRRYEAGDTAGAIVYLFSHQLIELDRRGLLRLVKGTTNRQYLRELKRAAPHEPRAAQIVARTMLLFEASFFGAHAPTAEQFEACWRETVELVRLIAPPEEAAA